MKRFSILCILLASVCTMQAKVTMAPIFADNMVLQQQSDAALWGSADPGSKVVITPSWTKTKTVTKAGEDGKWFARVATPVAGGPYEITISDGEKLTLKNVLVGEVWICSGQSNMEMPMKGFWGQPVDGSTDLILGAKKSTQIRSCNLKREKSLTVQDECPATWYEHTPEGVAEASATAYFFAKRLYETLDIPVGIINVSWGGTPIEGWMNPELLKKEFGGELDLSHFDTGIWPKYDWQAPGVLYNGMLHSVIPYTAKGFIWYQGCNNRDRFEQYKRLQTAFVKMLRSEWGNEDMPFYFTQIAPYAYENPDSPISGYMMWAQAQTVDLIPHSGMACIHDAGELACIHPANKKVVGDRLAFLALMNDYGFDNIDAKTPVPVAIEYRDGGALLTFDAGRMGLSPISVELDGFELAGEDKVFYPAKGIVLWNNCNQVWVHDCPQVEKPVAVRYGIRNWSEATLFNCYGIPASPFRSDDW